MCFGLFDLMTSIRGWGRKWISNICNTHRQRTSQNSQWWEWDFPDQKENVYVLVDYIHHIPVSNCIQDWKVIEMSWIPCRQRNDVVKSMLSWFNTFKILMARQQSNIVIVVPIQVMKIRKIFVDYLSRKII